MAPRGDGVGGAESAGFSEIPVRFLDKSPVSRCLLVKPHRAREPAAARPQNRTLFVLNVPPYCTQESVHRLFSQCGAVVSVELQDRPGPGTKPEAKKSKFFSRKPAEHHVPAPLLGALPMKACSPNGSLYACVVTVGEHPQGFQVAYVVFKKPAGMMSALKVQEPWVLSPKEHPIKTGLQKWIQEYSSSIIDPEALQSDVNEFMKQHDERVAELEAAADAEDGVPDEEGWVKVTRKGRRPGVPRTEARSLQAIQREKRKRAQKELLNFYSWQRKDAKREHIAELRKKFEEDKQRIAVMRAERKFKPY